jgi:ABC-2 type transport system permease protein
MRAYAAILRAGFRRQAAYRVAVLSGLFTNLFFGVVRTAVFVALYRQRPAMRGLDLADSLTYVWLGQALFGVVWTPWMEDLPESVRSGGFTAELTRPRDPYLRLLAFDLGRNLSQMLLRSVVPIAAGGLVLSLTMPTTAPGILLLAAAMLLAAVAGFQVRFIFVSCAFWTADWRFLSGMQITVLWLLCGFVIPTDFFPGPLRALADASPLYALLMAPVDVAVGNDPVRAVAMQAAWILALGVAGRAVMALAQRRMVVHGG